MQTPISTPRWRMIASFLLMSLFLGSCALRRSTYSYAKSDRSEVGARLLSLATPLMGKPHGYRSPQLPYPLDCSGLVSYLYQEVGIFLPRSSHDMFLTSVPIQTPQEGDLLFFLGSNRHSSRVGHVGILIGVDENGEWVMLHVSSSLGVVVERPMQNRYFASRYVGAGRVLEVENH